MLHSRIVPLLQNESPMVASVLSSLFHTSQIVSRKCRKERQRSCEPPSVAIILCGCGYLDGTEISEAISAAIHVTQKDMKPSFYAPDVEICDIIDHCSKKPDLNSSPRNALVEAARLSRSSIKPLCECEACTHGALIIPGGFGAAKTLSDFAEKGADCTVIPDLEKLIEDFYCEKKPIGSICIASAVVAKVLKGVRVTLGKDSPAEDWPYADAIGKVRSMGAKVELKNVKGVTRCKKYNVFSTPAWMYKSGTFADVHNGIGKLITMLKKCINQ
ncbi:ES1 protein homolog, mitochondrial [Anthophora quadrimaculata]